MTDIYSKEKLIIVLMNDINSEFNTINVYLENIDRLNYAKNKHQIDILVLESFIHASSLAKRVLALHEGNSGVLDKNALDLVTTEEVALHEIYEFEAKSVIDAKTKKVLLDLAKAETKHQKLVKSLK